VAFKSPYVYGYITKLCITQAEVILNHVNPKDKPCIGNTRGLNLAVVKPMIDQLTAVPGWLNKFRHNLLHKPELTEILCIPCTNVI
jgi:hypothetical protein